MEIDKKTIKLITEGIDRLEGLAGVGKLFRKHIPQPWRNVVIAVVCEFYDSDYVQAGTYVSNLLLAIYDGYTPPEPPTSDTPRKTLQLPDDEAIEMTNILIEALRRQGFIVGNYFLVYGPDHKPENAHQLQYDDYEEHLNSKLHVREKDIIDPKQHRRRINHRPIRTTPRQSS